MSTKTLRKRIALVAVSALGAGLLSVVPVTSANASATDAANVSTNVATGVPLASVGGTAGSVGLLAEAGAGTTQTAVLLATGSLNAFIADDADATTTASATVTGGRFVAATAATISGTSSASAAAAATDSAVGLSVVPNSGVTSMVIEIYQNTTTASTLTARITVSVAATSTFDKFSTAYSYAYWGAGAGADTLTTDATPSNSTKSTGLVLTGDIGLYDSYGNRLSTSNTGLLTATASTGALVKLGSSVTKGDIATAYLAVTGLNVPFNVQQADADVAWNGTITFAFNGVVFATKSGILTGEVAKVTVGTPKLGKTGVANVGAAVIAYADAAGNTLYPTSGTSSVSSSLNSIVTGLSVGTYPTAVPATGYLTMTCSLVGSAPALQVEHLNGSGTVVKSNTWASACSTVPYTYTAAFDKAVYAPGSVATLTISFKDVYGAPGNAYDSVGTTAGGLISVTGGPSATAVTIPVDGDKPYYLTGAKTYQFIVGTTEGDFSAVVSVPVVNTTNTKQTNVTVSYSVKATSTGVSMADVLKAIVSLIASINKQIAALQKALLKK
jgi:hypothetical protein